MKFILCVFLFGVLWSSPSYSLKKIRVGLGEPNSPLTKNVIDTEDKWFLQKLDHFNPTDNRTWKQRYQVNQKYYKKDGPVFLMIGGEGPISAKWMYSGAWIDYAKEFNALCLQLEHRYYGKSHPTEDMSTKNLVYLSSEQALTDLAEFIVNIRTNYDIPTTAKWVAFGGSYPGSLAAWLRMKFPHLVYAAVSSSGPLLAKIDFKEYFKVVENALATYSPDCVSQIKEANQMIDSQIKTIKGAKLIENKFKLCDPLDINTKNDVANLFETLAGNFADIVQYNKDNRFYENFERSLVTLETLCDVMVNKSKTTPLDRYADVNSKLLSINNLTCTQHVYTKMIDSYLNTSWNSDSAAGGRQWTYQTCTEFGFYQTSSQEDHAFGDKFPAKFFIDMCSDIFGKLYNLDLLSNAIKRSNMMYGELNIKENRVIYVHGSVDPWHALGITHTKTKNNVAIYIEGTAHCANMYPPSPTDLPQLKNARETIRAFLSEWLTENDIDDSSEVNNIQFKYKV
ncbi:putative serine protease K12H4.7 [Acyrthosiphon pisum]|uniref:Serine protease K12H4.7 n=1 Tax=Acyrthosiphon pisum TaxID=7029 RepID=A0A8R1W1Y9_ACYPI|nr:putative serine protease K12H4.7 [Acyrthosiphon pisum]|eukprot:XP_001949662.1 PREDICTED: putative serine protease K12H4.7 [Acyrthosiphon pisum]